MIRAGCLAHGQFQIGKKGRPVLVNGKPNERIPSKPMSHAVGCSKPINPPVYRAIMMAIWINSGIKIWLSLKRTMR